MPASEPTPQTVEALVRAIGLMVTWLHADESDAALREHVEHLYGLLDEDRIEDWQGRTVFGLVGLVGHLLACLEQVAGIESLAILQAVAQASLEPSFGS